MVTIIWICLILFALGIFYFPETKTLNSYDEVKKNANKSSYDEGFAQELKDGKRNREGLYVAIALTSSGYSTLLSSMGFEKNS